MIEMVREFRPNGLPIMIDGVVAGDEVIPDSIRIYPIENDTLGYPFFGHMDPDDLGKKIASRLNVIRRKYASGDPNVFPDPSRDR
jgi:hypothetical protein